MKKKQEKILILILIIAILILIVAGIFAHPLLLFLALFMMAILGFMVGVLK